MRASVRSRSFVATFALGLGLAAPASGGESAYQRICFACHDKKVVHPLSLGAPRLGDRAAWESRIARGKQALYEVTLNGRPPNIAPMPRGDLTDDEVRAAVDYMVKRSR